MKKIGEVQITLRIPTEGELYVVKSTKDVIDLWRAGADGKIVLVDDAGVTTLGPILPKLAGIVCTSGGVGSHLAIVIREFSIPALMGTRIECVDAINKKRVVIKPCDGTRGEIILVE